MLNQIERRLNALEQLAAPTARNAIGCCYEYDDAHRCIGIHVNDTLIERKPGETKEQVLARVEQQRNDGAERLFLVVDFVAAKDGRPRVLGDYAIAKRA
jgi:hypothetical protein